MQKAARDLREAAEAANTMPAPDLAAGLEEGNEPADGEGEEAADAHSPHGSPRDPKSGVAGKSEDELREIKEMVRKKTGRAWGELPGHLRNEILQMQAGRYREDYARVIQLYFREIAAGGAREKGAGGGG